MRVLILTPLFPPDVSPAAVYAKRLAASLATIPQTTVTVLHYGNLPESAGAARLISVKKDTGLITRLFRYTRSLWSLRHTDVTLILNGPSVEFPYLLLAVFLTGQPVFIQNDTIALQSRRRLPTLLHTLMRSRVTATITPPIDLLTPPLLHPLDATSKTALEGFNAAWEHHMTSITKLCQN